MDDTPYLVPVGEVPGEVLTELSSRLEEVLGIACRVAPALPHPSVAFDERREQYLSTDILSGLKRLDLPRAFRILGVVELDLYVPDLNFVFGQATRGGREALVALPRLRQSFYGLEENPELFRQRLLKEAVHELGHTLGLKHCTRRTCVMWFSNCLRDTDVKGESFCPSCRSMLGELD